MKIHRQIILLVICGAGLLAAGPARALEKVGVRFGGAANLSTYTVAADSFSTFDSRDYDNFQYGRFNLLYATVYEFTPRLQAGLAYRLLSIKETVDRQSERLWYGQAGINGRYKFYNRGKLFAFADGDAGYWFYYTEFRDWMNRYRIYYDAKLGLGYKFNINYEAALHFSRAGFYAYTGTLGSNYAGYSMWSVGLDLAVFPFKREKQFRNN